MRGLTIFTAKYAGRCCQCTGPVMRGDTAGRLYGRQGVMCPRCTRIARGMEATALDHRITAHRAAHATREPDAGEDA
jgi:hypothetical protein